MRSFFYIFLLLIVFNIHAHSRGAALCTKDSDECKEPADGGDLFQFVKHAHKTGRNLDKQTVQDHLSLGEYDQHRNQAHKIAGEINAHSENEMSAWIRQAKAALAEKNPNAMAMLNTVKALAAAGNKFLGISEPHEEIRQELQEAKSVVSQVNVQVQKTVQTRYNLASDGHRLSKTARASSDRIFDSLSNYLDDPSLENLGTVQINNATDLKRFYQVVRDRRLSNEHALKTLTEYEKAIKEWQSRVDQLQENSPWYEEEAADLQAQYLLLQQLRK